MDRFSCSSHDEHDRNGGFYMKILYLGNSITLHGINHDIGWHNEWGMAASALEKDYVHILNRRMEEETGESVDFLVRNIADFEREPDTFDLENFAELREFMPDVLVLRICENTPEDKVDAFGEAYPRLIEYFRRDALRIFAVGAFWQHEKKEAIIRKGAEIPGVQYVSLEHLHSADYQAIGLFEHPGVAGHPSDRGMEGIASAIFAAYRNPLSAQMRAFDKCPTAFLPLSLTHGFGYRTDAPIAEKQRIIRAVLDDLQSKGFGGLVTNVCQSGAYLRDDEEWFLLRWLVQTCTEMGLRVWLYDEKGYPSGGAGGLTLDEGNPDWQAQGLVMKAVTFAAGEPISIPFPKGHTGVYAAYAWKTDNLDSLSEEDLLSPWKTYDLTGTADLTDENTTGEPVTAAVFYRKPMYEGTHAIHNVCEARRYIDVSNKEAVAAFLENTYRPYAEKLAGAGTIEAIFTDEPSYMGAYINLGLLPNSIRDEFDETMEFLPSVNWGADVDNRFASVCGYDLKSRVYCLFTGRGEEAMRVRQQFYGVLSDLYEQSFFVQISDFCAKHDLPFSGHVLLEDDIRYHPVFEGNFFSLLRHMHIPGIDMLHGIPERIRQDAFTPKLVSSIAHAYRRPHVMSEISAHAQGGKVTPEQFYGTMTTQYVLGVDVFTSYFSKNHLDAPEYARYNRAVGRIDRILGGGRHISGTAVYYPIETVQADTVPHGSDQIYEWMHKNPLANACWNSVRDTMNTLLDHQIDFDFADAEILEKARLGDGSFAIGDETFRVLVVPYCLDTPRLQAILRRYEDHGVTVIRLSEKETPDTLPERIHAVLPPVIRLTDAPQVLCLCRENADGRSILLVNTTPDAVSVPAQIPDWNTAVLFDPLTEETETVCAGGFPLTLPPYGAKIAVQSFS